MDRWSGLWDKCQISYRESSANQCCINPRVIYMYNQVLSDARSGECNFAGIKGIDVNDLRYAWKVRFTMCVRVSYVAQW